MRRFLRSLTTMLALCVPLQSFGQNALANNKVAALQHLNSIALVVRPQALYEIVPTKEWIDLVEVKLARDLPSLSVSPSSEKATAWLEVRYITTDRGAVVQLLLHRWVTLPATKRDAFVPVWEEVRAIFGSTSRKEIEHAVDSLVTTFAADYVRGNR